MIALLAFNTFTASAANDPSGKCMLGYLKEKDTTVYRTMNPEYSVFERPADAGFNCIRKLEDTSHTIKCL